MFVIKPFTQLVLQIRAEHVGAARGRGLYGGLLSRRHAQAKNAIPPLAEALLRNDWQEATEKLEEFANCASNVMDQNNNDVDEAIY